MLLKTLHIKDRKFDLDQLDNILKKELPGKYHIIWHTRKNIWELKLNWNGTDYMDLYD